MSKVLRVVVVWQRREAGATGNLIRTSMLLLGRWFPGWEVIKPWVRLPV